MTEIGPILDNFLSRTSTQKLWVMDANDQYTVMVRDWEPVQNAVTAAKADLITKCSYWQANYMTDRTWQPTMTNPPRHDRAHVHVQRISRPPGTESDVCGRAYYAYTVRVPAHPMAFAPPVQPRSGFQSRNLYLCSIGSFALFTTVNTIDCSNRTAEMNFWIYNAMTRTSFGRFANYFPQSGMQTQYMWWHWTESYQWQPSTVLRTGFMRGQSGQWNMQW